MNDYLLLFIMQEQTKSIGDGDGDGGEPRTTHLNADAGQDSGWDRDRAVMDRPVHLHHGSWLRTGSITTPPGPGTGDDLEPRWESNQTKSSSNVPVQIMMPTGEASPSSQTVRVRFCQAIQIA